MAFELRRLDPKRYYTFPTRRRRLEKGRSLIFSAFQATKQAENFVDVYPRLYNFQKKILDYDFQKRITDCIQRLDKIETKLNSITKQMQENNFQIDVPSLNRLAQKLHTPKLCNCTTQLLMRDGCHCGGQ